MEDQSILPDTIEALRKLSEDARLRPQERASIEKEMQDIEEFTAKLENGRVEIAAFGEVGSGKSALLNALAGEQIFAVSAEHGSTDKVSKAGFKNTRLILVDTPGINEAAGELRGKLAEETVRYTDLVLFVADGDLNRVEVDALKELCDLHKPMLLVINKADLLAPAQVKEISESILRKVGHRIGAADIVFAAAAPRETEREIHKADGSIEIVRYQPKPKIDMLEKRMLEVLDREGKAIIALNASLFATDVSEQISALKQHVRGKEVTRLIYYFMLGKALVVGANPVPVFDVLAGMASDALMVQRIGAIYGTDFSLKNAQGMVLEILRAWGLMAAAEYGLHVAADLLRTVTFGTSTVLTAVPQGLAAAWSTYVVGNAANVYFRDAGWGGRSPKEIVQEILTGAETQKTSILAPIRDQLKAKFGRSRLAYVQGILRVSCMRVTQTGSGPKWPARRHSSENPSLDCQGQIGGVSFPLSPPYEGSKHDRQAQPRRDRRARHRQGGGGLPRRARRRRFGRRAAAGPRRNHRVHHLAEHQDRAARAARRRLADREIPRAQPGRRHASCLL